MSAARASRTATGLAADSDMPRSWRISGDKRRIVAIAPGRTRTRGSPWAAARMGVGTAPAESPPVLRGPREVCAGQHPAYPNHGRATDPILLAVAHGDLALTSRGHRRRRLTPSPLSVIAAPTYARAVSGSSRSNSASVTIATSG